MTLVEPPTPLLPQRLGDRTLADPLFGQTGQTNQVSGESFSAVNCAPQAKMAETTATTSNAGDGRPCAAILAEDGLVRYAAGTYRRETLGVQVEVWAEQFGDTTGAYSAYTFYRALMKGPRSGGAETTEKQVDGRTTSESATADGGVLVWAGTSVLQVQGRGLSKTEISSLIAGLPKVGGRKGLPPLLPTFFPAAGIESSTLKYSLGPAGYQAMGGELPEGVLSWNKSAEVATANYRGRGGRGALTLLLYPTPQIAADQGRMIERTVNEASAGGHGFGMVKLRRIGPLVGMTSGALSSEQAAGLIGALHLREEVSFDKPMPLEFHAEVQKTASLLQNIAVFCGVMVLAAVLLGLFLGGARAGIRVLQGKSAASEPEFLTINLRDRPKALFSRKSSEDEVQG